MYIDYITKRNKMKGDTARNMGRYVVVENIHSLLWCWRAAEQICPSDSRLLLASLASKPKYLLILRMQHIV